jgi:hypothetical protein
MKKILFQLFIVFFFGLATSQVTVVNMPRKMALYPRLAPADTGCTTISGSIDSTGSKYTSMRIKAYRNNALVTTQSQTLSFTGKIAPFSFNYGIKAELAMYKFELLGVAGSVETLIKSADSIRSTNVSKALSIDVSGYCKGLYIMQVSTPGGVMTNKIVLQ